ncbi:MAG TPA: metal ABC transporter ATP-binding protein [Halanaerobiaceae bacterium]|jgi:zinc transport system ATP-binding protein|nr:metal ABC transporter ATP-binding protein [Bacillota bacterium]HHU92421.1 metal ABC transporter ATP-binding protein [Halanaerobiaceae bacterium]HOA40561.1 metal ABC transporter ATP-binding protein [Halanaerobiales bacterium]HPZ62713.1 metal ABC transporter ATP-binding protein [Halanaerobiales bacterium]HQD04076.1 metal ABC transporter ATP-binding protein [Halanaerobiales bacterium]
MNKMAEVRNLYFSYGQEPVLKDINLGINRGDFIVFIGPNGSGKSTLLKLMIGELKPDRGQIQLLGKELNTLREWHRIGYMSQQIRNFNKSFPATVKEVVAAALYKEMGLIKVLNKRLEKRVDEVLELVGMEDFRDRQIGRLSGGQQQKVFIARTLVTKPELIFLDEPLVGIDLNSQEELIKLLNRLNQDLNITIIMVAHELQLIREAQQIAYFNGGEVFLYSQEDFASIGYLNKDILKAETGPEIQYSNGGDYNA